MKKTNGRKSGQAMTEYIIIVVIVALAAIAIFAIFGQTIQHKVSGAVNELGGDSAAASAAVDKNPQDYLKDLSKDGAQ